LRAHLAVYRTLPCALNQFRSRVRRDLPARAPAERITDPRYVTSRCCACKLDRASGCESRPGRRRSAGSGPQSRGDPRGRAGCRKPLWRKQARGLRLQPRQSHNGGAEPEVGYVGISPVRRRVACSSPRKYRSLTLVGLPPILREPPLLVLSPHFDDAALSCAALIAREEPIDVVTVFAGRPDPPRQGAWDRRTGFSDSAESNRVRRAEEQAAFAGSPHRLTFLDLVELEYLTASRMRGDAEPIAAAVGHWLEENSHGVVAVPAGAGRSSGLITRARRRMGVRIPLRHLDHVFVRDATLDAVPFHSGAQAVLYEEFPYLWGAAADEEVQLSARTRGLSAQLIVTSVDRRAKASRISVYVSQVPHLTVQDRRVDLAENLPEEERYWILHSEAAR
jgi:LmbE family N-acetylglucosaminyl deacetylase